MRVRDVSADIPVAARYVSFVDEQLSGVEALCGRRALCIVPCGSDADVDRAAAQARSLPDVWGVRVRTDRPGLLEGYEYFVLAIDQLDRVASQTSSMSEDAMAIIAELMEVGGRFMEAVAFAVDHPRDADLAELFGRPASDAVWTEIAGVLRAFSEACDADELDRFRIRRPLREAS